MNIKGILAVLLVVVCTAFVSAGESGYSISVTNPEEGYLFRTIEPSVDVDFNFSVAGDISTSGFGCMISLDKDGSVSEHPVEVSKEGNGHLTLSLEEGIYEWEVVCFNKDLKSYSGPNSFEIIFNRYINIENPSPSDDQVFETQANELEIIFTFSVDTNLNSEELWCTIAIGSLESYTIYEIEMDEEMNAVGNVTLPIGSTQWAVLCKNEFVGPDTLVVSDIMDLTINQVIPSTNSGSSNTNRNVEEEGGGRRRPILANLVELDSGIENPEVQEGDNGEPALITGAVIGAIGERGALGLGILLVVVGIVGLAVYNRESLGLVKAKASN